MFYGAWVIQSLTRSLTFRVLQNRGTTEFTTKFISMYARFWTVDYSHFIRSTKTLILREHQQTKEREHSFQENVTCRYYFWVRLCCHYPFSFSRNFWSTPYVVLCLLFIWSWELTAMNSKFDKTLHTISFIKRAS